MGSSRDPRQRFRDIADNIAAIREFISGMDLAMFLESRRTTYAVTRALEIISEASRRLPDEFKDRHPGLDWPAIAAAGNVYRHEYESVDDALLWHTVQHSLNALEHAVLEELRKLNQEQPQ